jgi:GLPGLI family protein
VISLQAQQGKVIYDQVRKLNIKMEGMDDEIKNMLPSMAETTKELIFKGEGSLYKDVTVDKLHEFSSDQAQGMMNVQIKTRASREQTYINHKEGTKLDQREIMDKLFIIESNLGKKKWKILNEQKEILGYTCMKASISENDSTTVIAWFTPQIQISAGPSDYFGLPGLILEVNQNEGEVLCKARSIDMDAMVEIVLPKEGERVSQEKFDKIQEKKRKEMEEMYGAKGGNGVFIIRTGNQ